MADEALEVAAALAAVLSRGEQRMRVRPATVRVASGFAPLGGGLEGISSALSAQVGVRVDGDTTDSWAMNLTGEPLGVDARVMVLFSPPQGAYVVGLISHWPTERGLLAAAELRGVADTTLTKATGGAWTDLDATNLAVTFTVPSSGRVRVRMQSWFATLASGTVYWGARAGTDAPDTVGDGGASAGVWDGSGVGPRIHADVPVTGLTPGQELTWAWAFFHGNAAGAEYYHGPSWGPIRMEVWAMPPEG